MWTDRTRRAPSRALLLLLRGLPLALLAGCSTRLDPTRAIPPVDAGLERDAGSAGDCTAMQGAEGRYWVCAGPLASYERARAACEARGAALVSVSSAAENAALAGWAYELGTLTNLWIGGTRDDAQVWRWPDGSVFWQGLIDGVAPAGVYTNWQSGEPNNTSTVSDEPERCAALALFDSGWRDRACSIELSYVCELPPESP